MLALDDPRWESLNGGYRVPYDPRPALLRLAGSDDVEGAWKELWNELHHQGDVGEASYAAVPHLVRLHEERVVHDWNTFAVAACIEIVRNRGKNPQIPDWLRTSYDAAWASLPRLALADLANCDDPIFVRCTLAVIALSKGLPAAAEMILDFDEDELREVRAAYEGA